MRSDFADATARGLNAGTSEAVTRGENCDARWLRHFLSRQTATRVTRPLRWSYQQGHWLAKPRDPDAYYRLIANKSLSDYRRKDVPLRQTPAESPPGADADGRKEASSPNATVSSLSSYC